MAGKVSEKIANPRVTRDSFQLQSKWFGGIKFRLCEDGLLEERHGFQGTPFWERARFLHAGPDVDERPVPFKHLDESEDWKQDR